MAQRKGSRRVSRKSRKATRKGRKASRKASRRSSRRCWSRRNNMMGGAAPLTDISMVAAGKQSLAQGADFAALHRAQHGGAAVSLAAAAPVGYTGMLDDSLRMTARVGPLDAAIGAIQGMRDQSGGGRRRGKKGGRIARSLRAASKKVKSAQRKMMKLMRRFSMKVRKMRGGAALNPADYGTPGMLLGAADSAKALMGMNPEWKLAADPAAFAPK